MGLAKHWGLRDSIMWGLALAEAVVEAESVLECDLSRVPVWLKALGEKSVGPTEVAKTSTTACVHKFAHELSPAYNKIAKILAAVFVK